MLAEEEKLWLYDVVEPGQAGEITVVQLTAANIAEYARVAQNPDPQYREDAARRDYSGAAVAMATMVLSYAPLLREDIARANGFVAQEASATARRQTPFAKCEIRWQRPAREGDTIYGSRRVLEKYERRGSRFVTFRVEASNQHGEPVAEYDYTCIFDYAQVRKEVPDDTGTAASASAPDQPGVATVRTVLTFDGISLQDPLAPLSLSESQEIINGKDAFRLAGEHNPINIHTDEEFARQNMFSGTVSSGPAAMAYVDQMLAQSFPLPAFYQGGTLLLRGIEPFRAGDTVTWQGEITGKTEKDGQKIVECRVRGVNQRGDLVNLSDAALNLSD